MDRPAIVIRDIHHYGDDLTVPEATARLRDGWQVTVTVTDPAPPEGDPRGNPRPGFDITVRPALGGQPELPPEISWQARTFQAPASAALFAEALTLAGQLAGCAGPPGGQSALARAAAAGPRPGARRRAARPRPRHARRLPRDHLPARRRRPRHQSPARRARLVRRPRPGHLLRHQPDGRPVLAAVEDAFFTAGGEALFAEAERIARERAAEYPGASSQHGQA